MAPQPSRGLTPAQQRQRRSKILAIGLGVVFLGVCAIQVPKLMKGSHATTEQTAAPVASNSTSSASDPATATLDPDVAATPVGPAPPGQLTSFTQFAFKNPFLAQAGTSPSTDSAPTSKSSSKASAPTSAKTSPQQQPVTQPVVSKPATKTAQKPPKKMVKKPAKKVVKVKPKPLPPNAALISTDGKNELVAVGVSFPKAAPLFKLVALDPKLKLIHIGVIDGSFMSGGPTLPVHPGQKITLANETDGSTYSVKFVKLVAATESQLAAAAGSSSTSGSPASSSSSTPGTTTTSSAPTTTQATTTTASSTTTTTSATTTTQGSTTSTQAAPPGTPPTEGK
jgi:hypothetical protein